MNMKKLCLLIALVASPVFAQEEEQEIQIEIETGGGVQVATSSAGGSRTVIGFPDKSLFLYNGEGDMIYCEVDDEGNPRCEEVDVED